ncbi:MAG: 4Fe-4S binding protein [candidate division KSB1 bacterium]|nr:4Fe-4S binding protein [candidate division KSB1 bacterium]
MSAKSWREIPIGGDIVEAGNSVEYKTGGWRTFKPVWYPERCIHCLFCWLYCPEPAILVEDGKMVGINYDFCKGCGICVKECPDRAHALELVREK